MENLQSVRFLLRKKDWMLKLDLKDAYFTVPVLPSFHKFLRFSWRGRIYEYFCMPFGLAPAPRVFTKLLKVVVAFLRKLGIRLVIYLDDLLFMNQSKEGALADFKVAVDLLQSLGFLINWPKSSDEPKQVIEYLGLVVDSLLLSFSLPTEKVTSVINLCRKALTAEHVSLRDVASLLGNFNWAIPTVPFAQAHYRSMQQFYIAETRKSRGDLSVLRALTETARADLRWWVANLASVNGRLFFPKEADLEICSDASFEGWGAVCNGVTSRGPWLAGDAARKINERELLAALFAIQSFVGYSSHLSVRIFVDNISAICYINHCGGTRSRALNDAALRFSSFCEDRHLSVEAVYLKGTLNVIADRESRTSCDASDWCIDDLSFSRIRALWPVEIDLFAAAWNARLPLFVSWRPQPGAHAVNAFSLNWSGISAYLFPPFSLIAKCLAKIKRDRANVVFVCPAWPTQPWFPLLLEMSRDVPRLLQVTPDLLTDPKGIPHPLLLNDALSLTVWRLSGIPSETKAFRNSCQTFSWPETDQLLLPLTTAHGTAGLIGVFDGVQIPCAPL